MSDKNKKTNIEKNNSMLILLSFLLTLFGCINWLSIGMLQYDIVAGFFGTQASIFSRIIYIIIGFSALWLIVTSIKQKGKICLFNRKEKKENEESGEERAIQK